MKILLSMILVLSSLNFYAQDSYSWKQSMECEMDIMMNVENHNFNGSQKLVYTNNSPDELNRAFFYLFFNAFQPGSMMDMRSRTIQDPDSRVGERIFSLEENQQGFLHVKNMIMNGKVVETKEVGTILECELPEPIKPGESVEFEFMFEGQVPLQIRRSGRQNKEGVRYSMTQWFPKMCEYDEQGWHANPYIGREFHGVWGDYDVKITIDGEYMIGATGTLQNADEIGKGYSKKKVKNRSRKNTWHFKAENVIDFAWAADSDFIHDKLQIKNGPELHFIYQNDEEIVQNWKEMQRYAAEAMNFLSTNYGKYPYPQYTIIQGGDGGMEYPMITLITGKRSLKSLVGVTVHEMAHSWFQGVIATNESLYEWMDEGFTTYASGECMTYLFGDSGDPVNYRSLQGYINLTESGVEEPMSTHADHYNTNYAYGQAAYSKGSVFLNQLRYIVGEEAFRKGMIDYFEQWGFDHPTPNDFIRVFEKNTGLELDWYLQYFVNTTKTIDYSLSVTADATETNVNISRLGLMPMPIDLVVTLKNGEQHLYQIPMVIMRGEKAEEKGYDSWNILPDWPWVNPNYDFSLDYSSDKIESIQIDPSFRLADVNPENHIWPMPEAEKAESPDEK